MSKTITGNLFDIDKGIIVHQVNCQGVMGAGLAKQIKEKWPRVFLRYKRLCDLYKNKDILDALRGRVEPCLVKDNFCVYNLFGQLNYGKKKYCYTDYHAHEKAWAWIERERNINQKIYAPFYIGAGLAGGDWKKIHEIAEKHVPDIIWVKYDED